MTERNWRQELRPSNYNTPDVIRELQVGDHTSITITASTLEGLNEGIESTRDSLKRTASRVTAQTGNKFTTRLFRTVAKDLAIGGIMVIRTE